MHLNRLKLAIRPNNQITLTYGNYRNVKSYYQTRANQMLTFDTEYGERQTRILHQLEVKRRPKYDWRGYPVPIETEKAKKPEIGSTPKLDIIKKSQRKPKSCKLHRPKSFTSSAGQKLRECGAAIDQITAQPRFTHEVTLTLPANHSLAFAALASQSGYIINRLFQPIRRKYGSLCLWFFVWEYQKRGALHLHIAVYHPDECEGLWICTQLIEHWHKLLIDISERCDTDMFLSKHSDRATLRQFHQHHCQPMKRSLGAYFSKYAGKKESKQAWYCQKYPVSRFWGCCQPLKEIIKTLSFTLEINMENSDFIQEVVDKVLESFARLNIEISDVSDFNVSKQYESNPALCLALGQRITGYCPVKEYLSVLVGFVDLQGVF